MAAHKTDDSGFTQAIDQFTAAIELNRSNYTLYSNRSAAYIRLGRYAEAMEDAKRILELKPDWPKGFYRLGMALQGMDDHEEAMVAFSQGLATDPKDNAMLTALVETMLKSTLKENFEPKLKQFQELKLEKTPFIVVSLVGQELLSSGRLHQSLRVLEAARSIGTDSARLEASLLQTLGHAYWQSGSVSQALEYMERNLSVNLNNKDERAQCKSHANLGVAYASLGQFQEALYHHEQQLRCAEIVGDNQECLDALNQMATCVMKLGNPIQAALFYKDAYKIARQLTDRSIMFQQLLKVANFFQSTNDLDSSLVWHHKHLLLAKDKRDKKEESLAYANLGQINHARGNYEQAMMFYQQLLSVAVELNDKKMKAKAYGGMGQANESMFNYYYAQACREQQLKLSRELKDTETETTALSQLGHILQATQKISQAMSYYSQCLTLCQQRKDRAAEGRAYANLGQCHMILGNLREAVKFFKHELTIAKEVNDPASEVTTLGNLGMAYLALENYEEAHEHLTKSLQLAKELNDESLECQALSSLGNFYTKRSQHQHALPHLNKALRMAKSLKDFGLEYKICHNLGACQEALGNHQQAVQFYQHDFVVAKEAKDKEGMTRACEKLINANQLIGDVVQADIYKKKLLNMAEEMEHTSNRCCLLNKMAEDLLKAGDYEQAINFYQQLLSEAKREQHQSFEGLAYCGLGNAYLALDKLDNALSQYQRDLTIRKESSDTTGECNAYGNLGSVYNCMGQLQQACNCYERSLALAQQLDNPLLISEAYSCLGIVYRNMKNYEEAIRMHQKQLEIVLALKDQLVEHSKAYANLGESYEAVVNFAHAVHCHEQHLVLMQKLNDPLGLLIAYASLGRTNRGLGRLPQALSYFRKRLEVAKELDYFWFTIECYADLAGVHMLMGNYSEALSIYNKQFHLARDVGNHADEASAACGLGEVNLALNRHKESLDYFHHDWRICHEMGMLDGEARALGNIAEHFEGLGDYQTAIEHREKQLEIANQIQDDVLKAVAMHGLGVINIHLHYHSKAIKMLKQALALISGSQEVELEAKIRYYLGLAFFHTNEFEFAYVSLTRAVPLFDQLYQGTNAFFDYSTKRTLSLHSKLYQTLMHVLVKQNKVEEALSVAEKERKRAIVDIFLEKGVCRQVLQNVGLLKEQSLTPEAVVEIVTSYRAPVIYYTIALGHLFIWLIVPKNGIVQFRHCDLQTLDMVGSDNTSVYSQISSSYIPLVDRVIAVRQALGIEQMRNFSASSRAYDELEFDDTDSLDSGEYYSAGKLGSVSSSGGYGRGSHINLHPIHDLYDILIRPIEASLPKPLVPGSNYGRLIIIPDRDLYLVPFALLKGEGSSQFLYKRYHLCLVPSVYALMASTRHKVPLHRRASVSGTRGNTTSGSPPSDFSSKVYRSQSFTRFKHNSTPIVPSSDQLNQEMFAADPLVVGNPTAPLNAPTVVFPNLAAEREVNVVADLLNVKPLVGTAATKERFLQQLSLAESIHLAASVSWAKGEIILAPKMDSSDMLDDSVRRMGNGRVGGEGSAMSMRGVADGAVSSVPSPAEYIVTLEDILTAKLSAKLVVISSCYKPEHSYLRADHILAIVQAFLVGGVQCVVIPLWPNSSNSSRHLMNAFYSSLVRGSRTSRGMCYAMQTIHSVQKSSHPLHWAGFAVIGKDIVLKDNSVELSLAIRSLLQGSLDYAIAALKTIQAMVVTSLRRIQESNTEPKYVAKTSVEQKVGPVHGWQELLSSVGFHIIENLKKEVPPMIFFPDHDDSGMQRKCRRHIESLLGIPNSALKALQSLAKHPELASTLLAALRQALLSILNITSQEKGTQIQVDMTCWKAKGCKEFFSSFHFDMADMNQYYVTLYAPIVAVERSILEYGVGTILAIYGPEEQMEVFSTKYDLDSERTQDESKQIVMTKKDSIPLPKHTESDVLESVLVLLVTATEHEILATQQYLQPLDGHESIYRFDQSGQQIKGVTYYIGKYGACPAAITNLTPDFQIHDTTSMMADQCFPNIYAIIIVGIACSIKRNVKILDILVSSAVINNKTPSDINDNLSKRDVISVSHRLIKVFTQQFQWPNDAIKKYLIDTGLRIPNVKTGVILSESYLDNLSSGRITLVRSLTNEVIGIEMNGTHLFISNQWNKANTIIVKAVSSNFGDVSNNEVYQPIAALLAADLVHERLSDPKVYEMFKGRLLLRQMVQQAKSEGLTINVRHAKIVFCGAAKAGKTSFSRLLRNEDHKKIYESTSAGDTQQVLVSEKVKIVGTKVNVVGRNWVSLDSKLETQEITNRLIRKLQIGEIPKHINKDDSSVGITSVKLDIPAFENAVDSNNHTDAEDKNASNIKESNSELNNYIAENQSLAATCNSELSTSSIAEVTAPYNIIDPNKRIGIEEEMVNYTDFVNEPVSKLIETIPDTWDLFTLLDTGGQPEFINMLPAINSSAAITFVVLDISDGRKCLDNLVSAQYQCEGYNYDKYDLKYTNMDLIKCLLFSTKVSAMKKDFHVDIVKKITEDEHPNPVVCIIGTHADILQRNCSETYNEEISKINEKVKKMVDTIQLHKMKDVLIFMCNNDRKYLIPVDNTVSNVTLQEDYFESEIVKDIQEIREVSTNILRKKAQYEIPISWFILELELRSYDNVCIPLAEVKNICDRIMPSHRKINVSQIKEILKFYHSYGMLLYFSEVDGINNYVITNPEWLFHNLTEIVMCKFKDNVKTLYKAHLIEEMENGICSMELLKNLKLDLQGIELESFIKLLVHLKVITPMKTMDNAYFIPNILPPCDESNTFIEQECGEPAAYTVDGKYVCEEVEPLLIQFTCGTIPRGLFGYLVVQLLHNNPETFELYGKNDDVLRICADLICFHIKPWWYVILYDKIFYLELQVRVKCNGYSYHYEAQTAVTKALENVCEEFNWQFSKYCYGFLCHEHAKGFQDEHLTLLDTNPPFVNEVPKYACCKEQQSTRLSKAHTIWFEDVKELPKPCDVATKESDRPKISELHKHVKKEVSTRWYNLGVQLLNHEQVKQLKIIQFNNPRDSEKCCVELFDYWLQVDSTASWSKLITALQYIDHDVLASKIKRMISKGKWHPDAIIKVYKKFRAELIATLPMNDTVFLELLRGQNLIPSNHKEWVEPRAAWFLDKAIDPFLGINEFESFNSLLHVMKDKMYLNNNSLIKLAEEIEEQLYKETSHIFKAPQQSTATNSLSDIGVLTKTPDCPDMHHLNKIVIPRIKAKWKNVAFSMKYSSLTIEAIERESYDLEECCQMLFTKWLSTSHHPTWKALLDYIKDVDDLVAAAEEIENELYSIRVGCSDVSNPGQTSSSS